MEPIKILLLAEKGDWARERLEQDKKRDWTSPLNPGLGFPVELTTVEKMVIFSLELTTGRYDLLLLSAELLGEKPKAETLREIGACSSAPIIIFGGDPNLDAWVKDGLAKAVAWDVSLYPLIKQYTGPAAS